MKNLNSNKIKTKRKITEPEFTLFNFSFSDAELITLKAINALSSADVILYDELVNPEIFKYAPYDSPKFQIKKKSNDRQFVKEQINKLLVDLAFTYGHVVYVQGASLDLTNEADEIIEYLDNFNIKINLVNLTPQTRSFLLN